MVQAEQITGVVPALDLYEPGVIRPIGTPDRILGVVVVQIVDIPPSREMGLQGGISRTRPSNVLGSRCGVPPDGRDEDVVPWPPVGYRGVRHTDARLRSRVGLDPDLAHRPG